jgi:hypothetical protein
MQNNDLQTIWQNQNTEEIKVSLTYFKLKAEQLRSKNLWIALTNDFVCVAAAALLGFVSLKTSSLTSRAGLILLAAGLLYVMYETHRQLWPRSLASGATPETGLEAYRRELLQSQSMQHTVWRRLAALLPGATIFAASIIAPVSTNPTLLINALPFCVLLVVWFVALIVVRKRRIRSIQQELDALAS